MCPPAPDPPAGEFLNGVDEQVIMYLYRFRHGNPLPKNVIDDINPYHYKPSNLPGGIWYLVSSTEKKKTESGFWREKCAPSEILTSSAISGRRTTMEFIEFQDAREQKTNWVMQEYKITEKGLCGTSREKESRAMCRVFLLDGQSSSIEIEPDMREAVIVCRNPVPSVVSVVQSTDSISEQGSRSISLVNTEADRNKRVSEVDRRLEPRIRDISELHYISDGDYLELDDLADPQPSSTSSDNSSCSSLTLDEYFNSQALLQELEDKNNQGLQEKDSNSKFSINATVQAFEVVMQPPTLGMISGLYQCGKQPPVGGTIPSSILKKQNVGERIPDHSVNKLKAKKKDEDSSGSLGATTSLDSGISMSKGKKKAAGVKTKRLKKYFCFMRF